MSTIAAVPVDRVHPNTYNPNRMSEKELAELVGEVRHLGRIPKPVVVRPHGDGEYEIVDGEHGWRAAMANGLTEIPCEVLEVDDFEAMRQTYKRNQHGSHNPVLLGQMFQTMMADRGLSIRAFAKEIAISEGTVRNALVYAEAAKMRNGYAFERLSIRQVREYLSLPVEIGDAWLDSGADVGVLRRALTVAVPVEGPGGEHRPWTLEVMADDLAAVIARGLTKYLDHRRFVDTMHSAVKLWWWEKRYGLFIPGLEPYVDAVAESGLGVSVLDELPVRVVDGSPRFTVSPEEWATSLATAVALSKQGENAVAVFSSAMRVACRKAGHQPEEMVDPRTVEALDAVANGPSWLQEADLGVWDKLMLLRVAAVGFEGVPELPEPVLEAAAGLLVIRDQILSGRHPDLEGLDVEALGKVAVQWANLTVVGAVEREYSRQKWEKSLEDRAELFADKPKLVAAIVEHMKRRSVRMRTEEVAGRPAAVLFAERLELLPWPELRLLGSFILEGGSAAESFWLETVGEAS